MWTHMHWPGFNRFSDNIPAKKSVSIIWICSKSPALKPLCREREVWFTGKTYWSQIIQQLFSGPKVANFYIFFNIFFYILFSLKVLLSLHLWIENNCQFVSLWILFLLHVCNLLNKDLVTCKGVSQWHRCKQGLSIICAICFSNPK